MISFDLSALSGVKLDHCLLVEELREVLSLRKRDDLSGHVCHVSLDVHRNRSPFVVIHLRDLGAAFALSNADDVADSNSVARDVDDLAVHRDVAVRHHLSGLENGVCKSQSPNDGRKPKLEQAKEVEGAVPVHSLRLLKGVAELLFHHVVVASDDLLGQKLFAVFARSLVAKVRTVLSSRIRALGAWALALAPDVKADSSANVVFSSSISSHVCLLNF